MRRRIPFFPSPRSSYSLFPEASGDKREATRDGTIGDVSANIRVTSVPLSSNRYSFRCLKSSLKMLHPRPLTRCVEMVEKLAVDCEYEELFAV